jgi:hypothetical protein
MLPEDFNELLAKSGFYEQVTGVKCFFVFPFIASLPLLFVVIVPGMTRHDVKLRGESTLTPLPLRYQS